jgi:hypothetical protein
MKQTILILKALLKSERKGYGQLYDDLTPSERTEWKAEIRAIETTLRLIEEKAETINAIKSILKKR